MPARVVAVAVAVALAGLALVVPAPSGGAAATACVPGAMPYAGIVGATFVPEVRASLDVPPVEYVRWRGTVPGFDGMPFAVDVTVPCGATGPQPTVVMAHGFTDDKTVWEETDHSDTVESTGRPETNSRWNNIWFASRDYTVVNYTARGWHDSCGPDTPGAVGLVPAPQCAAFEFWIHLDDKRWEVRDAQWLAGALVQSGSADPARLAITGGSYGGAPTAMAALLGGRTMCGGSAVPAALGPDPCAGKADGELVAWTTPDGTTPLTWVAALPLYTFGDLITTLAPNGRRTDGWALAPPDGNPTDPFGVPIASTVAGLLAAGETAGYFAPPLVDDDADIFTDSARLLAGNPFPQDDPLVQRGIHLYRDFKSPITTVPTTRVPIFWVQGFTDPLFPGTEALTVRNAVLAVDAGYPFQLFLGDLGHDYTGQRQDEWDLVKQQMNDFVDHYLRPDRTPQAPAFDVGATVTRCLDHDAPLRYVAAPDWHDLHPEHITFESTDPGMTSTFTIGSSGLATDPISTATLPLPGSYKGCRILRPSETDPTVATYEFAVDRDLVLMGGPVVAVAFTTTGPDVPLSVRLWDVAADGSAQGLVTRGTYRVAEGPGAIDVTFQIAPQGYLFPAGHRIKVEVTANDAPYFQASNIPAVVTVEALTLTLPLLEVPGAPVPGSGAPGAASMPATGGGAVSPMLALLAAVAALGLAQAARSARTAAQRSASSS